MLKQEVQQQENIIIHRNTIFIYQFVDAFQ